MEDNLDAVRARARRYRLEQQRQQQRRGTPSQPPEVAHERSAAANSASATSGPMDTLDVALLGDRISRLERRSREDREARVKLEAIVKEQRQEIKSLRTKLSAQGRSGDLGTRIAALEGAQLQTGEIAAQIITHFERTHMPLISHITAQVEDLERRMSLRESSAEPPLANHRTAVPAPVVEKRSPSTRSPLSIWAPVAGPSLSPRAQAVGIAAAAVEDASSQAKDIFTHGTFDSVEAEEAWIKQEATRQVEALTLQNSARSWLKRSSPGPPPLPSRDKAHTRDAQPEAGGMTPRTEQFVQHAQQVSTSDDSTARSVESEVLLLLDSATQATLKGEAHVAHHNFLAAEAALHAALANCNVSQDKRAMFEAMAASCRERASLFVPDNDTPTASAEIA